MLHLGQGAHRPTALGMAERRIRSLADQRVTKQRDLCRPVSHQRVLLAPVANRQVPGRVASDHGAGQR